MLGGYIIRNAKRRQKMTVETEGSEYKIGKVDADALYREIYSSAKEIFGLSESRAVYVAKLFSDPWRRQDNAQSSPSGETTNHLHK